MTSTVAESKSRRPGRRSGGWAEEQSPLIYAIGRVIVGIVLRFWIRRFRAIGADRVPKDGGIFLIANHTSAFDPPLLAWPIKQRMLRGPGKIELFQHRIGGWVLKKIGIFPLRQGVADAAAVRVMVELFRKGEIVAVYPEGGRSPNEDLLPFVPDFARLLIRLKAPIVPAAIAGAGGVLPIGTVIPRPNQAVAVVYGEPFDLSQFYDRQLTAEVVEEAARLLHSKVQELLEQAQGVRDQL